LLASVAVTAAALLSVPSLTPVSAAGDDLPVSVGAVSPPGKPLTQFDISFIDAVRAEYFLADRSNAAIDIVPLTVNPPVFQIVPPAPNGFAGVSPAGNDFSGPDGVITFDDPFNPVGGQIWAGDGPTFNPVCGTMQPCSTVKVITITGNISAIPTFGTARADELCWAPPQTAFGITVPGTVLVANDADTPPFDSFIPTDNQNGATPNVVSQRIGIPNATAGIEQCQWDGSVTLAFPFFNGVFYQTLPTDGNGPNGAVLVWARSFPTGQFSLIAVGNPPSGLCSALAGLEIGPRGVGGVNVNLGDRQILLGCGGTTTAITVNKLNPSAPINVYANAGGSDQVAYTRQAAAGGVGHFWTTGRGVFPVQQVAQIDPLQGPFPIASSVPVDDIIPIGMPGNSGLSAHSIASWAGVPDGLGLLEAVVVPIPAGGTSTIPFSSTVCGTAFLKGCIAFGIVQPLPGFPDL
jgi:hypothetical protein